MAGDKHYKGTVGTNMIINVGENITGATDTKFKIQKPDGTKVDWNATIYNNNYLKYTVQEGDWNVWGDYKLHSWMTINGWTGPGDLVIFTIETLFNERNS